MSSKQDEKKKKKYRRSLSGGRIEKKPEIKHKISFKKTLNHILRKSRSTSNVTTVSEETTTIRYNQNWNSNYGIVQRKKYVSQQTDIHRHTWISGDKPFYMHSEYYVHMQDMSSNIYQMSGRAFCYIQLNVRQRTQNVGQRSKGFTKHCMPTINHPKG